MKQLFKMGVFCLSFFMLSTSVNAAPINGRDTLIEEELNSYSFDFEIADLNGYAKKSCQKSNVEQEFMSSCISQTKSDMIAGLVRSEIKAYDKLTKDDANDIFCYQKGDAYTKFDTVQNKPVEHTADKDFCEINFYLNVLTSGEEIKTISKIVNGNIKTAVLSNNVATEINKIFNIIPGAIAVTDIDVINHYLNYEATGSAMFSSKSAIKEFAILKELSEKYPQYQFTVSFEDNRSGDYGSANNKGVIFIKKDKTIVGSIKSNFIVGSLFFVPSGTPNDKVKSTLEARLNSYAKGLATIKIGDFTPTEDNNGYGDISYLYEKATGIIPADYYKKYNTNHEKEMNILDVDQEYRQYYSNAIAGKTYTMTFNGEKRGIVIAPLDQDKINSYGTVTSYDESGLFIKSNASNIPLDTTLEVKMLSFTDAQNQALKKLGFKGIESVDLTAKSALSSTEFKSFNDDMSVYVPITDANKTYYAVFINGDTVEKYKGYVVKIDGKDYLKFNTRHFSNYLVAEDTTSNPKTGDNLLLYITIGVLSLTAIAGAKKMITSKKED